MLLTFKLLMLGVLGDSEGLFLGGFVLAQTPVSSALHAFIALLYGVKVALSWDFVPFKVQAVLSYDWRLAAARLVHVTRPANTVAHILAKEAAHFGSVEQWRSSSLQLGLWRVSSQ